MGRRSWRTASSAALLGEEFLFLEEGLGELLWVEWLEVVRLFAEADEFDGEAEFFLDGDDHAAFAGAVEFGDDEAGEWDGFVEFARLVEGVHAGGGVEHEQDFVRRAGELLADDAMKFLQFLHQVVLGVQTAGGVDEEVVRVARAGGGD